MRNVLLVYLSQHLRSRRGGRGTREIKEVRVYCIIVYLP
jgi:hypothetical protein